MCLNEKERVLLFIHLCIYVHCSVQIWMNVMILEVLSSKYMQWTLKLCSQPPSLILEEDQARSITSSHPSGFLIRPSHECAWAQRGSYNVALITWLFVHYVPRSRPPSQAQSTLTLVWGKPPFPTPARTAPSLLQDLKLTLLFLKNFENFCMSGAESQLQRQQVTNNEHSSDDLSPPHSATGRRW